MNFPDMTGGFIFLGVLCGVCGYALIRMIEWSISHISIVIG